MADNDDGNRPQNPWGKPQRPRGAGGAPQGPDLNDVLRKLQQQFGGSQPPRIPFGGNILVMSIAAIAVLWLGSGFYRLQPGEQAVIQQFGAYKELVAVPGLKFAMPWPVQTVTRVQAALDRRTQIGFDDTGSMQQSGDDESLVLTSDANIVDIKVAVLWNITEANKFIFNIRDPETTIKQVAQSAIREVVGQTPLQSIINEGRGEVAIKIREATQKVLDSYDAGVNVSQVLILQNTVHPDVLESFKDVVAAKQDAERFKNEATIYRNDILPKARGEAAKLIQEAEAYKRTQVAAAKGDADRFKAIYAAYQSGKEVTRDRIYIETMESVMKNASKIVVDPSTGGILPYLPLTQKDKGAAQ